MDTALPQKFPFILDRNLAKANYKENQVLHVQWYSSPWCKCMCAGSYNNNEESPHDPDGVALVWNTRYKKNTPEYIFHCQSPVMCATFARYHTCLIPFLY